MEVTLMGLEFNLDNKGCEALAYSFVEILNSIVKEKNIDITYHIIAYKDKPLPEIGKCDSLRIRYKSYDFWHKAKKLFKNSDLVVDFTMGDSFSDIYGFKRFARMTLLKQLAIKNSKKFILGPQTYGPFNKTFVKKWAGWIIKNSTEVFARDNMSVKYVKDNYKVDIKKTIDVAFALPTKLAKKLEETDKIKIGFNPSALLWNGGYNGKNQFGLQFNYQEYCKKLLSIICNDDRYQVYLIPHVGNNALGHTSENDYYICEKLSQKFKNAIGIKENYSASEIKGIISQMDIFIGARMHATIGAFSSKVVTIPFSYSRKFEGLYNSIGYKHIISATKINLDEAINKTINYIDNYELIKIDVIKANELVERELRDFKLQMEEIL